MAVSRRVKRAPQNLKALRRKSKNRQQYEVVLIVCEGEKTEPNYFIGLRNHLQLNAENIHIVRSIRGTDPVSIVDEALEKYDKNGKDYDRVYCVFDKEYPNYEAALNKVQDHSKNGIPIYAITSVPCFEYWLLLHVKDSDKPYVQKGKKSPGDQLESELKKLVPGYSKADKDIFKKFKHGLDDAIKRAERLKASQKKAKTDNPSTDVYQLVGYLVGMGR